MSQATCLAVQAAEIVACEVCSEEAEIPLQWVLDAVTGLDEAKTDYVLHEPLKCPRCFALIDEETLVEWGDPASLR